jgi:hypothetical protein
LLDRCVERIGVCVQNGRFGQHERMFAKIPLLLAMNATYSSKASPGERLRRRDRIPRTSEHSDVRGFPMDAFACPARSVSDPRAGA